MYKKTMNHPHIPNTTDEKIGVIIVNLGTPDESSTKAVRRYLKEFLSDQRIIALNPLLWQIILRLLILPFRSSKTAKIYKKVWRNDTNESPLRYYTRRQAEHLKERFKNHDGIIVDYAMRYGNPSLRLVIHNLQKRGCNKLVILPLYPQYSASTTATVNDEIFRVLMKMRWQPTVRICPPYETNVLYIKALKNSILIHLKNIDWKPDYLVVSFHGIPLEYVEKGDPYKDFCERTFRTLQKELPKNTPKLKMTFQSKFGPKKWLEPYTEETLIDFANKGIKKIAIIAPGFAADCIETLEELQIECAEIFKKCGGTHFTQIPCSNDSDDAINLYESLIQESLGKWAEKNA